MRLIYLIVVLTFISCTNKKKSIFELTPNQLLSEANYLLNEKYSTYNDENADLLAGKIIIEYLYNPDNSKIELTFNDSIANIIYNKREELLSDPNYKLYENRYIQLKKESLKSNNSNDPDNSDCKEPDTSGKFMDLVVSRIKNKGCAISFNFFKGNGSYIIQAVCSDMGGAEEFEVVVNECGDILRVL